MSRMVREVGPGNEAELILFRIEPLSQHGHSRADFPGDAAMGDAFARLSDIVSRQQWSTIQIVD